VTLTFNVLYHAYILGNSSLSTCDSQLFYLIFSCTVFLNFSPVDVILCCSLYRVSVIESQGMSTTGRAGSASRRQADRELWSLRDNVLKLEEDLAVSQVQLHNVTRQYNCLVNLLHKYA